MLQKAVLSALVVCCGLLAKWLKVRVRVRVTARAGASGCTSCTFFFPLVYKCGEHLSSLARYIVSGSARDGLLMDIQWMT